MCFSALQRAEIAEIDRCARFVAPLAAVSVLFNEPKLLKCYEVAWRVVVVAGFSALQRAEIAEIRGDDMAWDGSLVFQCSSTSRNC